MFTVGHASPAEQAATALLDAMLAYLPDGVSLDNPDWLFRNLFLRRLLAEIRSQLMNNKTVLMRELAVRADKMWSGMSAATATAALSVCAVARSLEETVVQETEVSSIPSADSCTHQCCAVHGSGPDRKYCRHHRKWGSKAWNCKSKKLGNGRGGYRN